MSAEMHTPASLWKADIVTTDGGDSLLLRLLLSICLRGSKLSHFLFSNFHCYKYIYFPTKRVLLESMAVLLAFSV